MQASREDDAGKKADERDVHDHKNNNFQLWVFTGSVKIVKESLHI